MGNIVITAPEIVVLLMVGTLGHAMALIWYLAAKNKWKLCERTIYDMPIGDPQVRRELRNSWHAPIHAVILAVLLILGLFANTTLSSFAYSALATTFHWIHVEHHKSRLNSWLTAISFSFTEKVVFDLGLLGPLALLDRFFSLNFFGIAGWYIGYLVINSLSHANFELKSKDYNRVLGQVLTSTTHHSLHHARYTRNYGLGTRFLDRIFGTEWEDYEQVYARISRDKRALGKFPERAAILLRSRARR
jgi:sterol desaturase/sphingolipid hydroxylase (fatty acid hydroxylase superfamily)